MMPLNAALTQVCPEFLLTSGLAQVCLSACHCAALIGFSSCKLASCSASVGKHVLIVPLASLLVWPGMECNQEDTVLWEEDLVNCDVKDMAIMHH